MGLRSNKNKDSREAEKQRNNEAGKSRNFAEADKLKNIEAKKQGNRNPRKNITK